MMHLAWAVLFFSLSTSLTVFGYGSVHDGVLSGLILLGLLAAVGFYIKFLDERPR